MPGNISLANVNTLDDKKMQILPPRCTIKIQEES